MDDKQDLVSNLPNEVLKHILSFLPLEEAVRSSTLSTLWRQLLSPLSLCPHDHHRASINEALGKFLSSCLCHDRLNISLIEGVVVFAIKGVQQELYLHFVDKNHIKGRDNSFHLSLTSSTLDDPCAQSLGLFSSLKTLHLRSLNLHGASLVSDVFAGCHHLESFKVEKCMGLKDLRVAAGNSLRSLTVLDCLDIVSISVWAPTLTSFRYRGALPRLQLKNAMELVEATLDLRGGEGHNGFDCEDVLGLLSSLKEAHCLTISAWLLEWMCKGGVIFGWLEFGFNKLKELNWEMSSSMDRSKRDSLACFLNACPSLEKLFIQVDERVGVGSENNCPYFHQYWHEPHLWNDFETVKSNTMELKHLNMFKWSGFRGQEDEILLMELLLNKAIVLQSMVII